MDILLYIAAGAGVGFIVGLTGIGGGALMTPLLLTFGFPAHIAVGTDLLYASITKASGAYSHHRQRHVRWGLVKLLAAGSIPAALITGTLLSMFFDTSADYGDLLKSTLGAMLVLTACVILVRKRIQTFAARRNARNLAAFRPAATIAMGVLLGIFVTLSSVGAGAIGTAILMILYPALRSTNIVGTDIAHAVPLTLAAGLIHLGLGNVDFMLLGALLIGSIPAIHVGSLISRRVPDSILRPLRASLLMIMGVRYILLS
ncbi:MAG: sulfite exporter TauE/SafE family protein [Thalassolituus sp.]